MGITIYHNPRCSKSRQTLALLEENKIDANIILYLENSPSKETLAGLCKQLDTDAITMFRFKEDLAKELGLSAKDERSNDEWFDLLHNNIKLMERPIVSNGTKSIIGRPPENVLDII